MLYFDTSFLTPLFLPEATSLDVEKFVRALPADSLAISDWTRIEFSSLLAREVRMGALPSDIARIIDDEFGTVTAQSFHLMSITTADFDLARRYLRHYESGLRAGDALHLAIAKNREVAAIYSLDKTMLKAGLSLGLPVSAGVNSTG